MTQLSPVLTAEPDDNVRFASTQMQGIHEEFAEKDRRNQRQIEMISRMQLFKNEEEEPSQNSATPVAVVKRKQPPKKLKSKKKKKFSSLNVFVRDNLGAKDIRKSDSNLMNKILILDYFSGDKKKVNEILLRIEREEQNTSQQNYKSQSEPPLAATRIDSEDVGMLYTREEWFDILKNIKLKFPKLSSKTKRTLKTITRRIQMETDTQQSVWSQASALPSDDLTPEDLKWLYDLDEEEMQNEQSFIQDDSSHENQQPFVMTLSQAFDNDLTKEEAEEESNEVMTDNDLVKDDNKEEIKDVMTDNDELVPQEDEVEDSESEPEVIELSTQEVNSWKLKHTTINTEKHPDGWLSSEASERLVPQQEISSHQQVPTQEYNYPNSLMSAPSNIAQTLNLEEAANSLQPETAQEEIPSSIRSDVIKIDENSKEIESDAKEIESDDAIEIFSSSQVNYKDDEELIISSPARENDSLGPEFKTPTKRSKQLLTILSSPSKLILPIKRNLQQMQSLYSPVDLDHGMGNEEIIISSDEEDEEVFSTARMEMDIPVPQVLKSFDSASQLNTKKSRKVFNTSKIEIKGNLEVKENPKYKIRKIATHVISIDSDDEVADSEDDEKEASIIEITVPEEDAPEPRVQVPSSPSQYLISIDSQNTEQRGILSEDKEEGREDKEKQLGQTELNSMSVKQVRAQFEAWGLKPRSKAKMVDILQGFLALMNPSLAQSPETLLGKTQKEFRHQIYDTLTETIRSNAFWFNKVISYEPIFTEDLHTWLTSTLGVLVEREFFDKYCDELGITCTAAPKAWWWYQYCILTKNKNPSLHRIN